MPLNTTGEYETLEPYAQLLRALLPRTTGIGVYGAHAELLWSSEGTGGPDVARAVQESLSAAPLAPGAGGQFVMLEGEEPLYLFWLRRDGAGAEAPPFALVAATASRAATQGVDQRSFALVQSLVRPALECLRRELLAREEILQLNSSLLDYGQDLEMLLAVSGDGTAGSPDGADELKLILTNATQHLRVGLSALIVPDKGIALMQPAREAPLEGTLVARAHRHLLSLAQMRREAVIVNRMNMPSAKGTEQYRILSCPIARGDGRASGVLALFRAATEPEFTPHHARLTELLARRIASIIAHNYDALTGLFNRPAFEKRVHAALAARANGTANLSALFIDLNRMHLINDNFGMHVGDQVIAQLGELIRARLPPGSLASRISGDRFAVLLPARVQDAATFAESLRQGAERIGNTIGDGRMQVSVSIGAAPVEPRLKEFARAFAPAETACKAANDRGRNRVEVYQEADESIVRRFTDISLFDNLRNAISENRLRLWVQLIAPLNGRGRPHFEILLRMQSESGEIIGPDHFLSAALRYQMMPQIDRWVITEAVTQLKPHAPLLLQYPATFTINCSGQSLQDHGFTDFVSELILQSGLNPQAFCFELTESAAVGNLAHAEVLMRRLRGLGCDVALDDFGTGLSSLAYLRTLPISMLKIDGSFVRDVLTDARAESMVQAIAQLARSMGMVTVAEYVETDAIRQRVTALGVDYGQGFALARPIPLPELLDELPLYLAAAEPSGIWSGTAASGLHPSLLQPEAQA